MRPPSPGALHENVNVAASPSGLSLDPRAWWAVAGRLASAEGRRQPFERGTGRLVWLCRHPNWKGGS